MIRPMANQRGMTLWGWLYVLATLGVILVVGIKTVPVYLINYEVESVLEWAAQLEDLHNASEQQIQERIQRRLSAGYVDVIDGRDVAVQRTPAGRKLSVSYDESVHLFGNAWLHFKFHETAVISTASG